MTWTIIGGTTPAGVTFNADGSYGGTPTVADSGNFTWQVNDGAGGTGVQQINWTISPVVPPPPASYAITPTSLTGNVGVPMSGQFTATAQ